MSIGKMAKEGGNAIEDFLNPYFGEFIYTDDSSEEDAMIMQCLNYVSDRFTRMKYILGTGLDFVLLAQLLSKDDKNLNKYRPSLTIKDVFQQYKLVTTRGERKANTLSLSFNNGRDYGIRKIEESVLDFFHRMDRTDYPSAYVYNTGQWQKYQDLLENVFRLSESGRYKLAKALIDFGLKNLAKNTYYSREIQRHRLFERIIKLFPRGVEGENGGLIYQAIAYAYYSTDFSHLSIAVDKVRTGSSRQKRFGDIDCYYGLDLEISIEVKDFEVLTQNAYSIFSNLITNTKQKTVLGVAFVKDIEEGVEEVLDDEDIRIITQDDLLYLISLWDWQKQNKAVHSFLHYLAHIEQDVKSVNRLLTFISEIDPEHDSLVFFNKT